MNMKNITAILFAVAALLLVTACSRLTEDNLQKVHNGMTTDEVKAILGDPSSSQTGSALGIVSGTTYVYHTDTSDVKITFVDDKVIATEGDFK
jgi:outer membrane protein assembly factor BamE (lipoprotein component of BamABCDE complex)